MAGVTGLEPATSGVTGRHSNQLSYTPVAANDPSAPRCQGDTIHPVGCQAHLSSELGTEVRDFSLAAEVRPVSGLSGTCITRNVESADGFQ